MSNISKDLPGYHLCKIQKFEYGSFDKILEEVEEAIDSYEQDNKIMLLQELSDILGAIEGYLAHNHPSLTLEDLIIMKDATKRAFLSGQRR